MEGVGGGGVGMELHSFHAFYTSPCRIAKYTCRDCIILYKEQLMCPNFYRKDDKRFFIIILQIVLSTKYYKVILSQYNIHEQ